LTLSGNAAINAPGPSGRLEFRSGLTLSGKPACTLRAFRCGRGQQVGNATVSPTPVTGSGAFATAVTLAVPSVSGSSSSVSISGNSSLTINPGIYTQINVSGMPA